MHSHYSILVLSTLIFSACGNSESPAQVVSAVEPSVVDKEMVIVPTIKPGAAVLFASDFSGSLELGELAPLVIQLEPQYDSGLLQVSITGDAGLAVVGERQYSDRFVAGQQFEYEIVVSANQQGTYNLGVIVTVTTDSGLQEARAFSESISVGDTNELTDKAIDVQDESESPELEGETRLQAREEIFTN